MTRNAGNKHWKAALTIFAAVALAACAVEPGSESDTDVATSVGQSEQALAAVNASAAATGNLFLVGTIKDSSTAKAAVPGVVVTLTQPGGSKVNANTNSDGVYNFSNLPSGTYTVTAVKSGATFSPSSATFALNASAEHSVSCVSGCDGTTAVDPLKELTLVDPSVTGDARGLNASDGPWSLRFLFEQMTPAGMDPSDFVSTFLQGFRSTAGPINGFAVDDRDTSSLFRVWPNKSNGKLDLAQAPFRLLAIVNRSDLHVVGNGELRFIYGMATADETFPFTLILEYRLPTVNAATNAPLNRLSWINQFHALGSVAFGSTFNSKLQAITDQVVRAGKVPGNPNGSAISQVRSNEIQLSFIWQLREFHLVKNAAGQGILKLAQPAQTPDLTENNTAALGSYVLSSRLHIIGGLATVPSALIGGESTEDSVRDPWNLSGTPAVDEEARHAFAAQTCNGCHNGETSSTDGFYHISPFTSTTQDPLLGVSSFVRDNEFPRRKRFMQNRLTCKADFSDCSSGAEPMP